MAEIDMNDIDLQCCGNDTNTNEVPFCCVTTIPGNLDIDRDDLTPECINITFTPKLECCKSEEEVTCDISGVSCNIEACVLKLVGCIEYALSTEEPVIYGENSQNSRCQKVHACCNGTVCVNNIIACGENEITLECPSLSEIEVCIEKVKVKNCPYNTQETCPDKKIIKFIGKFILPTLFTEA